MREILAAGIMSLLAAMSGVHHGHHFSGMSINADGDDVQTCDDLRITFDDEKAVRAQDELPVGDLRSLKIASRDHGGIRVTGWDQPRYAVTACKAAVSDSALRDVRVSLSGNEVTSDAPAQETSTILSRSR